MIANVSLNSTVVSTTSSDAVSSLQSVADLGVSAFSTGPRTLQDLTSFAKFLPDPGSPLGPNGDGLSQDEDAMLAGLSGNDLANMRAVSWS